MYKIDREYLEYKEECEKTNTTPVSFEEFINLYIEELEVK